MIKNFRSKISKISHFYQWIILVKTSGEISTSFPSFQKIIPPKDRFWADPFVIFRNDKYYIFFEELIYSKNLGHISFIEMDKNGNYSEPRIVLERDYHLSYPSFFEFEKNLYFIHGSITQSKSSIEIFKCEEFPHKWNFYSKIVTDVPMVDTTMFQYNDKWWIFACESKADNTLKSKNLHLFFSDHPLSKHWTSHPKNPIVSDVRRARPAGQIFYLDKKIIRPGQDCFNLYGRGFSFNQIIKLDENEYEEKQIEYFEPNWDENFIGIHTFNYDCGCTVIDARIKRNRFL